MAHIRLSNGKIVTFIGEVEFSLESPVPIFNHTNSYSLTFDIRNTPENQIALGNPDLIDSVNNKKRQYDAEFVSKHFKTVGVLTISDTTQHGYKAYFVGQGAFFRKLSLLNMSETDIGEAHYPTGITHVPFDTVGEGTFIFNDNAGYPCFAFIPHFNYKIHDTLPFVYSSDTYIANDYSLTNISRYYRYVPRNPWLMLSYIMNSLPKANGFDVVENNIEGSAYEHIFVYNNQTTTLFRFTGTNIFTISSINVIDKDTLEITINDPEQFFPINSFIKISELTVGNKNNLNGRVFQKSDEDGTFGKFRIKTDTSSFTTGNVTSGNITVMSINTDFEAVFPLNRFLPNIKFKEFLSELWNILTIVALPGESIKTLKYRFMRNILQDIIFEDITKYSSEIKESTLGRYNSFLLSFSPVVDDYYKQQVRTLNKHNNIKTPVQTVASLPLTNNTNGDIRLVVSENKYYEWNNSDFGSRQANTNTDVYLGSWRFFSEWIDFGQFDANFVVKTKFAPIPTYITGTNTAGRKIPRIDISVNFDISTKETESGLRLCFLENNSGFPKGTIETPLASLRFDGAQGLYELLHKPVLDWVINRYRDVKAYINWPSRLLYNFAWDKKYRINSTNYLVKKIPVYISYDDKIRFGETELVRV